MVQKMWEDFIKTLGEKEAKSASFQSWPFGDGPEMAKELAGLVKSGRKTATCSLYELYEEENVPFPKVGEYNIITDWEGSPEVITKTTRVEVLPFNEVGADFAYKEGEGDRSYEYWRDEHIRFFTREMKQYDREFLEDTLIVCEEFEVVFPK